LSHAWLALIRSIQPGKAQSFKSVVRAYLLAPAHVLWIESRA